VENKIRNDLFPATLEALIRKVHTLAKPPEVAARLETKLRGVHFAGMDCDDQLKDTDRGDPLKALLVRNAIYTPSSNSFAYCQQMALEQTSEFALINTIAHELSHAIDPCNISEGPPSLRFGYVQASSRQELEDQFPFPGVVGCLRSASSVAARWNHAGFGKPATGAFKSTDTVAAPAPPKALSDSPFCNGSKTIEQVREGFSDWLAAEAVAELIPKRHPDISQEKFAIGVSKLSLLDECPAPPLEAVLVEDQVRREPVVFKHPLPIRRLNRIVLVQPELRQKMGCGSSPPSGRVYCRSGITRDEYPVSLPPLAQTPKPKIGTVPVNPKPKAVTAPGASKPVLKGKP
jgi:hypothetical protein